MTYPTYDEDLRDFGDAIKAMSPERRRALWMGAFRFRNDPDSPFREFWSAVGVLARNLDDAERDAARKILSTTFEPSEVAAL